MPKPLISIKKYLYPCLLGIYISINAIHSLELNYLVSPNTIKLGETFKTIIQLQTNDTINIKQDVQASDVDPLHLVSKDLEKTDHGYNLNYTFQLFTNELTHIPTLNITITKKNVLHKLIIPHTPIILHSNFTKEEQQVATLSNPYDNLKLPFDWITTIGLILATLNIISLVIITLKWIKHKKHPSQSTIEEKIEIPPLDEALSALSNLEATKLYAQKAYKEHYTALSEILKHFTSRITDTDLIERTTLECMSLIQESIPDYSLNKLKHILQCCDLVKFAKFIPTEEAHNAEISKCKVWLHKVAKEKEVTHDLR